MMRYAHTRSKGTLAILVATLAASVCPAFSFPSALPEGNGHAPQTAHLNIRSLTTSTYYDDEFELLYIDRFFWLDNQGLTRVIADLNGHRFKVTSDPHEASNGYNVYPMPSFGDVTIDILPYLNPDFNWMKIRVEGPRGTEATLVIGDSSINGICHCLDGPVDYILNLRPLPRIVEITQNYPNPFNSSTTIIYEVPDEFFGGAEVELAIYNIIGQRIRTLVNTRQYSGVFQVVWDGRSDVGVPVASGVYFYRLRVESKVETRRLVMMLK
jgi:hypothetical protein